MSGQPGQRKVREIFTEALGVPEPERTAFLERACDGDAELQAQVEHMLNALGRAGDFLACPTAAPIDSGATAATPDRNWVATNESEPRASLEPHSLVGKSIGPYKLMELIGEGGFGSVYAAQQERPIRRRVALKVIKAGMDSRAIIARFEQERQALALMDHPHIARVLDAGATDEGRPYFVMELVRGIPITRYCDENRLSPHDRLELLVPVCHAVQHAHQKGIIHRDLKPSNVLVTLHDGEPVPKVIDFGIAKATSQRLTEKTVYTELRAMIGTPAYMSPEQAEMSGLDIDTRSDIYSLGVLMYELLTGSTPFDTTQLLNAGLAGMQRIIREQEPVKPSTRVQQTSKNQNVETSRSPGSSSATIAARRRTDPRTLERTLRGELDWIVLKAMEKDRTRRYATANALAQDVLRYLNGEVIQAAPPSRAYRFRKLVRRNKGLFTSSAIVAAALVLGMVGTTLGLYRAREERDRAERVAYAARLAAAYAAIGNEDGTEAQRELLAVPERQRGWEWRHLCFSAHPWVREWSYTGGRGANCQVARGGRWATFLDSQTGQVHLFELGSSSTPVTIEGISDSFSAAFPSDDGRMIVLRAAIASNESIRAIDPVSGTTLWRRPERRCLGLRSDGTVVVAHGSTDPLVSIVDPQSGATLRTETSGCVVSSFGTTRTADHRLTPQAIYEHVNGESVALAQELRDKLNFEHSSAAEGPYAGELAVCVEQAEKTQQILLWHPLRDGHRTVSVRSGIASHRFRGDGERLLVGALNRVISASPLDEARDQSLLGIASPLCEVAPQSCMAYFAGNNGTIYLAPIYGAPSPWAFAAPFLIGNYGVGLSADARRLVTVDWGCVTLWDTVTGEPKWRAGGWSTFLRAAAISPDESLVAAGAELGKIRLYDARDGARIRDSASHSPDAAMGLAFSRDGRALLVGWSDGAVQRLAVDDLTRVEAAIPASGTCIDRLVLSPDGQTLVTVARGLGRFTSERVRAPAGPGHEQHTGVVVRAASNLRELGQCVMSDDPPTCASFSPDGARLAVGTRAGAVLLMDVRRPIRAAAFATLPAQIGALCWSPDGARLMAGGGDLVACVDSANGDVLLISHTPGRVALGFTPDGASLLAIDFSTATWLETRWPDEATLLARDRARLAMDWLRSERPWQINAAQAHTRLEQNHFHSAEVREKALALLSALREQPAQANNHAMLTSMAEKQRTDADRVQALEVLDAGIAQAPDAPNFYMTRSELLMQLQRFDEAVEAIEQARSLYAAAGITRVPLFDAWTALVRHRQGRTDESGRLLEQARATVAAEQDRELRASWQSELDEAVARIGQ